MPRRLLYVPIVHAEADLGDLAARAREATEKAQGPHAWARRQAIVNDFWLRLHAWAESQPTWAGVHLYQDGLPVCGHELAIVSEVAAKGSPNHRLLRTLIERGGVLMGTESPELLKRELDLARAQLDRPPGQAVDPRHADRARTLLERRDRFMADRIAATLPEAATGVLFIGAMHNVRRLVDPSIQVVDVTTPPPTNPAASAIAAAR